MRRRDTPPVLPPMSKCSPSAERRRPCPQAATALFNSRSSSPESHRSKAEKRFKWRKQLTQAEKRQDWRKRRQGLQLSKLTQAEKREDWRKRRQGVQLSKLSQAGKRRQRAARLGGVSAWSRERLRTSTSSRYPK